MKPIALNRLLSLEEREDTPDGHGGFHHQWQTLGQLWAQIDPLSGREVKMPERVLSRHAFRILLRASPPSSLQRPKPGQRLREMARIFTVLAVSELDPTGRYLQCQCYEETPL